MQRKLYTEFDLLFDFISASVFGPGNMVFIFQFFLGGLQVQLWCIWDIFLIHLAIMILTFIIQKIVTLSKYGHDALDICRP